MHHDSDVVPFFAEKPKKATVEQDEVDLSSLIQKEMERLGLTSGAYLSFSKLTYSVRQPIGAGNPSLLKSFKRIFMFWERPKQIWVPLLTDVSGYLKPGMMVLLLGPPGAGKTTLLELLSGRKMVNSDSRIFGEILVNGTPWTNDFNRIVGYVTQEDRHFATMTVRETLEFSSLLRNQKYVAYDQRISRVQIVLDQLGLSHTANTLVGNELLRGVSGGERKRVSIGVELVKGPGMLFMDEPTTGLDASAAYDVTKALRKIADRGIGVMCSLLQPSQELYDLFDHVLVLDSRRCVYFGPSSKVLDHFHDAGYDCPPNKNIAEFLLEVATPKRDKYRNDKPVSDLETFYKQSDQYTEVGRQLWEGVAPPPDAVTTLPSNSSYATGAFFQALMCTKRAFTNLFRNPGALRARAVRAIIVGLLLGTLFWNMGLDQQGAQNRISLMFFCITFTAMGSVASIPQVCEERALFLHQSAAHFYKTISYFASAVIVDIPLSSAETVLFATLVYWMTGLYHQEVHAGVVSYVMFVLILLLTNLASRQLCRLCAAITPNQGLASSIAPAALSMWLVFSGFLIPRNSMPIYWLWMNLFSVFRYTLESLAINEMEHLTFECTPSEFVPPDVPLSEQTCPIPNGLTVLNQFGFYTANYVIYVDVAIMFLYYVVLCLMTYLSLNFVRFTIRRSVTTEQAAKILNKRSPGDDLISLDTIKFSQDKSAVLEDTRGSNTVVGSFLSFRDLNYSVDLEETIVQKIRARINPKYRNRKTLLYDVCGFSRPGIMVALMGASGAGKTTLLDVIANRKTGGHTTGEQLINGRPKDKFFNRMIGYVEQLNVLMPTLTVFEALQFSAIMRLPEEMSIPEKMKRVELAMDQLGLRPVRNNLIGDPFEGGLSPELRKKLSIGIEFVAEPSILFLDEPTSGLDSQAAEGVMHAARMVSNSGVPVICTIHQPSADLFNLFDWLLLLKPGGRTIYFGPMGQSGDQVLEYFRRYGLECEPRKNPADFVLECSGAGIVKTKEVDEGANRIEKFDALAAWTASPEFREMEQALELGVPRRDGSEEHLVPRNQFKSEYAVNMMTQLKWCIWRAFVHKYRQPDVIVTGLITYIGMGLIIGSLYWQLPFNQAGARNRVSLIYFCIVFAGLAAISSIPGVIMLRAVFYREKPTFLRPFAYFVGMVLSEFPFLLVNAFLYCSIVYFMAGLNLNDFGIHYVYFVIGYCSTVATCVAFAQFTAVISPTGEIANTIVGVSLSIFSLFAGFIIPKSTIPWYWIWLHYISFFSYPLQALSINEMDGNHLFSCPNNLGAVVVQSTGYVYCPISSGSAYINTQYDMHNTMLYYWIDVGILISYYVFFLVVTYLGIRYISHLKR